MNDSVLNALLKLTHLILKYNNVKEEAAFLDSIKQHFKRFNIVIEDVVLYEKLNILKKNVLPSFKNFQHTHHKEEDVKSICTKLDTDLLSNEKIFIAICLVECTSKHNLYTEKTREILNQLVINCGINSREFQNVCEFILEKEDKKSIHLSDLFITGNTENVNEDLEGAWIEKNRPSEMENIPHIINDTIRGKIFFQYQQTLNNILFKFNGEGSIYLNKELVRPGELYLFKNKDKLISDNKVVVDYKELSNSILKHFSRNAIVYTGNSVEYNTKRQFNSLKNFTFSEKSGNLIALIGEKNSEKHVLIKLLAGELNPDNGNIHINCYDTKKNKYKTQGLIGYVASESRLRAGLTIYENYLYASKLFLRHFSNKKIKELILKTLNELGLQNLVSIVWDSQARENISELQYKLICLGFELIKDPSILILEEAFEGLTPIEIQALIGILREQAIKGKLIIVSSTPPLMYNIREFDRVWCFDKGGYPIYNGKADAMSAYFSELSKQAGDEKENNSNQDVWQIINRNKVDKNGGYTNKRRITPKVWNNFYNKNLAPKLKIYGSRNVLPQSRVKLLDLDKQLFIFLIRDLRAFFRQPPLFFSYLSVIATIAILTGMFCRHSVAGSYSFSANENVSFFYFLNILNALIFGIWIGVGSIKREGAFYRLNKLQNISSISYFSSKISLHILLMSVLFAFYVLISYSIINHLSAAFKHFLIYFLTGIAGSTVGYNIAIYTKSVRNIYLLSIVIIIYQILFSGLVVPFEKFPVALQGNKKYVPVMADLSIIKWGHEALMVEQAINNKYSSLLFDEEKFLALANFYDEIILPDLLKKVNNSFQLQKEIEKYQEFKKTLLTLRVEIEKIPKHFNVFPFEFVSYLNTENFSEEVGLECINYINYIDYFLFEESESTNKRLVAKLDSLGLDKKTALREKYFNKSIYNTVTNQDKFDKNMVADNNEASYLINQVYILPDSNLGRSHLYAYKKLFNGHYISTFWFNIIVIWLSIGVAYLFLITEFIHYTRNLLGKFFQYK